MAVTYDSHEAGAVGLAIAMVADSATWRGLQTPAATSTTEGKGRIIESDSSLDATEGQAGTNCLGAAITVAAPLCIVHGDEFPAEERGINTERRNGMITARFYIPTTAGDTAAERQRRARNVLGAIRAEIAARFRTAGYLCSGAASLAGPFLEDDTGAWMNTLVGDVKITYRG